MKKYPGVSIIIPLYVDSPRFLRDLKKFKKLDYLKYEIIVVSDKRIQIRDPKVRFLVTGKKRTGPAEKRDIAIKKSKGEICAFIDDDAYPHRDWLNNAVIHFQHPQIAAVGGPGLTPKEDNYWEQLTGLVYGSFFCGGHAQHRFIKKPARFVVDYPAYNLLVRKDVLNEIGGYGTHFYGGEDTFLCLKIIKKGYKILYDPEVVVYHHRRPLFVPYLRQIANIGKHRGYFAKRFPETSFRWMYFLPSGLALGFFILPFINWTFFIVLLMLFFGVGVCSVILKTNIWNSMLISLGIIATHVVYGINFIRGLIFNNLER
ncbi:MAG: Glycosyltransferase [Candidatus Woesebacteria bacterium GW2011_GWB1_43_14]|uniref:Glycosyltransferase n=1 Tax=Candidatus Woesebacteria bacterium GW2011_GWB1_43_14 TaxID=1618578 RepID=A0A0G1DHP5_9BACT|nr:MAG: Glycosyltransferase [Candidatus Woesebacteria bacterium GW2011_GWA1_39_11b]KKS78373.1 MAG: Glycosyltransferase [Candidatus Woesebacteria bacterium GW2011_GWC1_42_9]KKS97209.1 MAG: Glycosyltransferase [Candidatus Woesebacteria bacterium GW2011_GWB1_43_14]